MTDSNTEIQSNRQALCSELHALLPAYIVGATTQAEMQRVQELLPLCPEVMPELRDYASIAEALALQVDPVAPPVGLRERIWAELAADEPLHREVMAESARGRRRLKAGWSGWLAAAVAVILLIITNVVWLNQVSRLSEQMERMQHGYALARALLTADDTRRVVLLATDESQARLVTVLWRPSEPGALLLADRLPALPDDKTYQLWLINDDGPVSAGIFRTDERGITSYAFQPTADLRNFTALGVSVEPVSGSLAPTNNPLAIGMIHDQS